MAESIVRLRLDSGEYDQKIRAARDGLLEMERECRNVGGTLEVVEKDQLQFVQALGNMQTSARGVKGRINELSAAYVDLRAMYNRLTREEQQSAFGQAMSQSLSDLKGRVQEANAELSNIFSEISTSGGSAKADLRELTAELTNATLAYRAMSDEERNSPIGMAAKQHIEELTQQAGTLRDVIGDVTAAINNTASDTALFDQIGAGLGLVANGYALAKSAATLFGVESEGLAKTFVKLQAALVATNALTKIQAALQKQSALMQGVAALQTKAAAAAISIKTAAEGRGIIVTKAASVAQAAFNAVAWNNPYVIIAAAVAAVTLAIIGLTSANEDAAESQEDLNQAADDMKRSLDEIEIAANKELTMLRDLNRTLHDSVKGSEEWCAARNTAIQQFGQYDSQLATEIDRVGDLSSCYDRLTEAIRRSMRVKQMQTFYDQNEQNTQTQLQELRNQALREATTQQIFAGGSDTSVEERMRIINEVIDNGTGVRGLTAEQRQRLNIGTFRDADGNAHWIYSPTENNSLNSPVETTSASLGVRSRLNTSVNTLLRLIQQGAILRNQSDRRFRDYAASNGMSEQEAREAIFGTTTQREETTTTRTSTTQSVPQLRPGATTLSEIEENIRYYQAQLNNSTAETATEINAQIKHWQNLAGEIRNAGNVAATPQLRPEAQTLSEIQENVRYYQAQLSNATIETASEINAQIKYWQDLGNAITNAGRTTTDYSRLTQTNVDAVTRQLNNSLAISDIGGEAYNNATAKLADVNALSNLSQFAAGANIDISQFGDLWSKILSVDGDAVSDEDWQAIVDQINEKIKELNLDIEPIKLDVKTGNLDKEGKNVEKAWQSAAGAIGQVGSALQSIDDPVAKVAGLVAQAIAQVAATFAASLKGTFTPWDWIAGAAAGTATMISTIAAIKSATAGSYEHGGIVPGNSWSGDRLTANVNSGELILNRAQQANLAAQLDNDNQRSAASSRPYIQGETIYLGLNNYLRRSGKGEIVTAR